ncbi:patatin-like phospholipase family protein [Cupriavidus pauculus]|uniref:patatin-like phospholipase family protein n=1 Tax=Cupriavidus pauculus TaxID=82633 RepID=UPI001EE1D107|nr:patatin-like phospholipase family protein [Cupriavidus pauculus]GJG98638.1 patatin-like phospholipase family protein [Cupriavidus pauculus]
MSRAVVLGGGGVAGIAWATGVAAGMARQGVDIAQADAIVGTSAGSVVGAQIASGIGLEILQAGQLVPASQSRELVRRYSQAEADARNRELMQKVFGDVGAARRRIGAYALRSETVPLETRREIIAARLPRAAWPDRALRVVAVDTQTGEHAVFHQHSGVELVDAVAASCAVPGSWPAVPLNGRTYMDGGIRSLTNADLAPPAKSVIVIAPLGYADGNPVSGHLRAEISTLESRGARVVVIVPDAESLEAMTDNVLDPSRCVPSANAGLAQGLRIAGTVAPVWNR